MCTVTSAFVEGFFALWVVRGHMWVWCFVSGVGLLLCGKLLVIQIWNRVFVLLYLSLSPFTATFEVVADGVCVFVFVFVFAFVLMIWSGGWWCVFGLWKKIDFLLHFTCLWRCAHRTGCTAVNDRFLLAIFSLVSALRRSVLRHLCGLTPWWTSDHLCCWQHSLLLFISFLSFRQMSRSFTLTPKRMTPSFPPPLLAPFFIPHTHGSYRLVPRQQPGLVYLSLFTWSKAIIPWWVVGCRN